MSVHPPLPHLRTYLNVHSTLCPTPPNPARLCPLSSLVLISMSNVYYLDVNNKALIAGSVFVGMVVGQVRG